MLSTNVKVQKYFNSLLINAGISLLNLRLIPNGTYRYLLMTILLDDNFIYLETSGITLLRIPWDSNLNTYTVNAELFTMTYSHITDVHKRSPLINLPHKITKNKLIQLTVNIQEILKTLKNLQDASNFLTINVI